MTEGISNDFYQSIQSTEVQKSPEVALTENQKENIQIMDALSEKYPHAFTKDLDSKGRPFMTVKDHGLNREKNGDIPTHGFINQVSEFIISQNGVSQIDLTRENSELFQNKKFDLTPLVDIQSESGFVVLKDTEGTSSYEVNLSSQKNFRDENLASLKHIFTTAENRHLNDVPPSRPTVDSIINSL